MGMARSITVGGVAALTALALAVSPVAAQTPSPRTGLEERAQAIVDAGAPGVVIEVSDEDGARSGTAGVGNLRTGAEPDPDGRFRTGSLTKSFTATMVLQLVEEGLVDLDAPVDDYLPGLLPYEEPVTVRELLQHRSGLYNYAETLWPDPQAVREGRFEHYEPSELVGIATAHPLEPTEFAYSDTGYIVLGMLIEEVTGNRIRTELAQRILRPVGLGETYLAGDFPLLPNPAMRGYEAVGQGPLTDLTVYNMSVSWTTGAIVSTSDDLNRFYRALVTGELLGDEQLAQMQETVPAFPGFAYGLGLAGTEVCGQQIWGHVGGAQGYLSYSFSSADGARQITVTANQSLTAAPEVSTAITEAIAAEFCER
jgi:D-alanyl-D-alanine carboxypeptidase